VQVEKYKRNKT